MRIAFVKQKYVPFGGGEGVLQRLMAECTARGFEVHLITGSWLLEAAPVTVHRVRYPRLSRAARMRGFSRAAAREARRGRYDTVVSFDRTEFQDIWRAGEGVHLVWLQRRRLFEPWWKGVLTAASHAHRCILRLERTAVEVSRLIVTNSKMVAADIARVYGRKAEAKVRIVYNGVDRCLFRPDDKKDQRRAFRCEMGLTEGDLLLAFVGSGFRRKGLRELITVLRSLRRVFLVVAGRDPPGPWIRRARACGVAGRVRFVGPRQNPAGFYHGADLLVLPTWFDAFPNSTLEALACGTPVVTTRFSGSAEIIQPGRNGFVVDRPDDSSALADAVHAGLELGRSGVSRQIAETVADMTVEKCAERFLAAIGEMAGTRSEVGSSCLR